MLSKLRRWGTAVAVGVGLAASLASTGAAQAAAAPSPAETKASSSVGTTAVGWDRCPHGYFCLFDGRDGTGRMAYFQWGSPNLGWQGMDNLASSYWNRSGRTMCAYDAYDYIGDCVFSAWAYDVPRNIPDYYFANNRASSARLL